MKLIKKVLNRFNGLHFPQEYLCLPREPFENPLHIYLVHAGKVVEDITYRHAFVGYSPLVFALEDPHGDYSLIEMIFSHEIFEIAENVYDLEPLACLTLKKIRELESGDGTIYFFEGIHGSHAFILRLFQIINLLNYRMYGRKPGNVYLAGNLYKQVQVAYSIPRKISLITVGKDDLFNHFPTDLHGPIGNDLYLVSLRHEGKACAQVMESGSMVLSDVKASMYRVVYSLGRNHMQAMKERTAFEFSDKNSAHLHLPLPEQLVSYRELKLKDSFTYGIHRIMLFMVTYRENVDNEEETLVHIHNTYATWRYRNGLLSNYLLR